LNYKPAASSTFNVGYSFSDGTATFANNYTYNPDSPATFSNGLTSHPIQFQIVNDATVVDDLPVEYFNIHITSVDNGLNIGTPSTLTYTIYDNDPPPKVTFQEASASHSEGA